MSLVYKQTEWSRESNQNLWNNTTHSWTLDFWQWIQKWYNVKKKASPTNGVGLIVNGSISIILQKIQIKVNHILQPKNVLTKSNRRKNGGSVLNTLV